MHCAADFAFQAEYVDRFAVKVDFVAALLNRIRLWPVFLDLASAEP